MKSRGVGTAYGKTRCVLRSASPIAQLHIKIESISPTKGYGGRADPKSRLFEIAAGIEERC